MKDKANPSHAMLEISGHKVPLIGVSPEATLGWCDYCKQWFPRGDLAWLGNVMICPKCKKEK